MFYKRVIRKIRVIRVIVIVLLVSLTWCFDVSAQRQSGRVYEFLSLPQTARITALGGYAISAAEPDPGMFIVIPSLLSQDQLNHLSLNFMDYFDDINYGTVAFTHYYEGLGHFGGALQYVDYGRFTEADEFGRVTGSFSAGEYSLQLGWGRMLNENFSIGSNVKLIYSSFYDHDSFGLATDVAASYHDEERLFTAYFLARNIGRQLTYYHDGNREPLPFDLLIGFSKALENAPFLFSVVLTDLHNFDLSYEPAVEVPGTGQDENGDNFQDRVVDLAGNFLRHAVVGLEFTPVQSFSLRMGYNYRRRQEMKVDSRLSTVGFSWGFGLKINRFQINYGRSNYHLAGSPNHISISTSLQELFGSPETVPAVAFER